MSYYQTPDGKDPQLWYLARKRASFKSHLIIYLIVNAGLWLLWYFTGGRTYGTGIPWPVWSTLGWGIGLASHYVGAYVNTSNTSVEDEYNKLSTQKTNKQ